MDTFLVIMLIVTCYLIECGLIINEVYRIHQIILLQKD